MKTRHNRNTEAAGQQTTRSRGANPGRGVRPSGINRNSAVRSLSPAPRHLFASCCNVGTAPTPRRLQPRTQYRAQQQRIFKPLNIISYDKRFLYYLCK